MATYEFTITLSGEGDTPEEAWADAVAAFSNDPGVPPEDGVEMVDDE